VTDRIAPRIWETDTSAMQHLYHEPFMVRTPQAAAEKGCERRFGYAIRVCGAVGRE
jgi:hypothetical protein